VHSTNWSAQSLRHLFEAAMEFGLDVDLHCDEELNPRAVGLAATAALVREIGCTGRVICGHACALAAQSESQALATLDAVATVPITMVTLPTTNLLLQDAVAGRTPRWRGITLVKEARERGIPVLVASDNVQDAFCPIGSFDPLDALTAAVLAAQLDDPFDVWSEAVCRADWLARGAAQPPLRAGDPADLVVFGATDASGWPSAAQTRVVLRAGRLASGVVPARWQAERPSQAQVTR
jgi:cytosine deaminase